MTLDEAYVYLNDTNKPRAIFYRPRGVKKFQNWYTECRESFSKGFMIIAAFCYNGKLIIQRVEKKAKVNSVYYQEKVLSSIYFDEIPSLYGSEINNVRIHQDKASSHTSTWTLWFLEDMEDMEQKTAIHAVPYSDIPVKSPDAAPMDFCAFGLLKELLEVGGHALLKTYESLQGGAVQDRPRHPV